MKKFLKVLDKDASTCAVIFQIALMTKVIKIFSSSYKLEKVCWTRISKGIFNCTELTAWKSIKLFFLCFLDNKKQEN